jgi:hypothetical protein
MLYFLAAKINLPIKANSRVLYETEYTTIIGMQKILKHN